MAFIQRTGQDTVLRSDQLPAIAIQIDPEFKYAGSTSFILYDVARAEQHHFVIADAKRQVKRLLWFQLEGYLESNTRTYHYSGMEELSLNGYPFLHNTGSANVADSYEERPTSDFAHVVDFLREKGYGLSGDTIFHRLVWLDADLRNELMIIYAEFLDSTGELSGGAEWAEVSRGLQERSRSSFRVL